MIKLGAGGEKNEKDLTSEVFDEYMIKNENIEEIINNLLFKKEWNLDVNKKYISSLFVNELFIN